MLRTEPLGQLVGDRMGQGRSKHSSIDTASPTESFGHNGTVNGTAFSAAEFSSTGRLDASHRSANSVGRNPLKRARDEMETDGDDFNSDYKIQFSRSPKQPRSSSRGRERQSLSPTSMRHSFVPERNDDQWKRSTRHQHQRTNSGGSNPAHRQGRADQWLPSRTFSSPPPRRSISPPMRPPLGPRGASSTEHTVMRRSLPDNDHRASESLERPRYTNLKWTNPSIQSGRVTNGPASRPPASGSIVESPLSPVEKEVNGDLHAPNRTKERLDALKAAPTGPKLERNLIAANHAANRRPYIFISGDSLPTTASTLEHLFKFLAKWVRSKFDISFDSFGWYLYFDNNEKGLRQLDECFWAKNRHKLFSQYVLEMSRHPGGPGDSSQESSGKIEDHSMASVSAHLSRATDALKQIPTALREMGSAVSDQSQVQLSSVTTDPRLAQRAQNKAPPFSAETRANGYVPPFRHSSPLRVPTGVDRDDASSSISGLTGSDLSTSKVVKCHACKKVSDCDILVHCSTCPRRWHRRCHTPNIPLDLETDHPWQCRSCIRKNVQPKSRLSHASFTNDVSPVQSVGQPDEPPTKKRKLEKPESRQASVGLPNDNLTIAPEPEEVDTNGVLTQPVDSDQAYDPADVQEDDLDLGAMAHANTDELEDLVEKSFSTTNGVVKLQPKSKKPTMLNLTRKKLARPVTDETSNATEAESKDAEIEPEETSPKRERHKYTGRGADKAIIEAGMQNFFSDKRRGRDVTGNIEAAFQAAASGPQHSRLEVPESPEESRTPSKSKRAQNEYEHITAEPQTSPKIKLTLKNTKPSPRQETHGHKSQAAPSQRMKATGPSAGGRCQKCNKPIAFDPSGRKLCVRCKNTLTGDSATPPVEQNSKTHQREIGDVTVATPTAAEKIQSGIFDLLREEVSEASPLKDSTTQPSPSKPDAACETCRIRHKRCTHRSAPVPLETGDTNYSEEDADDDDLNLWKPGLDLDKSSRAIDKDKRRVSHEPDEAEPDDDDVPGYLSDRSSPLSTVPDDTPILATKVKKRTSHARPATNEYDIGDSFQRPNGSYTKLIGMALCASPGHCLNAKAIKEWIDANIPTYNSGEGSWEGGITATLSMGKERDGKTGSKAASWMKIGGDDPKKTSRCMYQLLPGKEHEMLNWDPVLKQPVSPMKHRSQDDGLMGNKKRAESSRQNHAVVKSLTGDDLTSPKQTTKKRLKISVAQTPKRPTKHAPKTVCEHPELPFAKSADMQDDDMEDELHKPESSEDEPLAATRNKHSASTKGRRGTQAAPHSTDESMPVDELANSNAVSTLSESTAPKTPLKLPIPPQSAAVDEKLIAQLIKEDAENVDYSAKSLYEEWPEWDPKNRFDREAKIAEIQARPTRKHKFGKQTQDPWAHWTRPSAPVRMEPSNFSSPKSNRIKSSYKDPVFEWQKNDDVKYYETFEEMFGVPELPVAILRDKEIAFRDGTREYDGSLRRANKIYPTGYAK